MRTEKEIKDQIKWTKEDRDANFSEGIETINYLSGFLSALEWVLDKEKR